MICGKEDGDFLPLATFFSAATFAFKEKTMVRRETQSRGKIEYRSHAEKRVQRHLKKNIKSTRLQVVFKTRFPRSQMEVLGFVWRRCLEHRFAFGRRAGVQKWTEKFFNLRSLTGTSDQSFRDEIKFFRKRELGNFATLLGHLGKIFFLHPLHPC